MTKQIIGLLGRKQAGKSTVARYLTEHYKMTEYSFADPLKRACMEIFGFTEDQLNIHKEQVDPFWGVSPRRILQTVGTDLFRNELSFQIARFQGRSVWIGSMEKRLLTAPSGPVVVSDIRFEDEHAFIKKKNGITIQIVRTTTVGDTHESETQHIPNVDYIIYNTGTLDDLHRQVDSIMQNL